MQNEKNGKFLNSQIENMRSAQAARYTGLSESTLAKLRMRHNRANGPSHIKISGCVVYRRSDLDSWMNQHVVRGDE
jgi:predicted DNA-binding transcriptional regulator AlpA